MGTDSDDADSLLRGVVGAAGAARRPLARGDVVAERFAIEQLAGAGGMGMVYRATDRATGGTVAVKVMQSRVGERERFAQEARVLAELSHPAIVRYLAHGPIDHERMFIAMEWLDGEDVARRLERERVAIADAIAIVRRTAEGLAVAHRRGIVHRDVKPSNLFLVSCDPAQLKVLDFGVARLATRPRPLTKTGAIVGTVGYLAPEQATGERDLDARADVFALGCVLFECLTGEPAFAAENAVAILAKVLCDEAPRVSSLRADVPAELDDLVARLLAKDRRERPADADAVVAALEQIKAVARDIAPTARGRLTGGEQRLVCVILAAGAHEVDSLAATFGADAAQLADGTHLLTLASRGGAATDHAARIASLALALRDANASARIALAMGRAETTGRHPAGPAIDRAAALLDGAPGSIRVDAVAASLLDTHFELRDSVLVARRDAEEARTLLGKPTPCVGRDKELALLDATLAESVGDGVARAVLVTAPPGVGKSRLRREFTRRCRQTVWLAHADPVGAGSSLAVVRQLVRAGRRGELDEFVLELVGEPTSTPSQLLRAARSDPALMGERMRRGFEDWLATACAAQPIAIVVEDLHWADAASVEYLGGALRRLRDQPLFVLALARPEVHDLFPRLWSDASQEIKLSGLTRRAAERLVRETLGDVAPDTLGRIVERADGNAYYLEELIRRVAEGGDADALPETILAMIESRLARLEPEARYVLRAASVFGEVFWANGVAALLGREARENDWLRALADRELLEQRVHARFAGETEYAFRHALLRDASYAMLVDADRATAHRLAAEWLERAGEHDAFVLGDHFERGADRTRAVAKYQVAVKQAYRASDMANAIAAAERGLALAPPPEIALDLNVRRSSAHWFRGDAAAAIVAGRAALGVSMPHSAEWYRAVRSVLVPLVQRGLRLEWEPIVAQLEAPPLSQALVMEHARTLSWAAIAMISAGEMTTSDRFVSQLAKPLEKAGDLGAAALAAVRAWRKLFMKDLLGTLHESQQAIRFYGSAGAYREAAFPRFVWCYGALRVGLIEQVLNDVSAFDTDATWAAAPLFRGPALQLAAIARAMCGQHDEALRTIERAIGVTATSGATFFGNALAAGARLCMEVGDFALAKTWLDKADEVVAGLPLQRSLVLGHRAQLHLLTADPMGALASLDEAARIDVAIGGAWELDSRAELIRVLALRRLGRAEQASAALASAVSELERRAAQLGSSELQAGFLDRVPVHAALRAGGLDASALGDVRASS